MTGPSTGRRHLSAAGRLIGLLASEVAVITENGPSDPGELVGERDGEHVGMQSPLRSCNPLLEPVTLPDLRLDQDDPGGLDKQNAQVAPGQFSVMTATSNARRPMRRPVALKCRRPVLGPLKAWPGSADAGLGKAE